MLADNSNHIAICKCIRSASCTLSTYTVSTTSHKNKEASSYNSDTSLKAGCWLVWQFKPWLLIDKESLHAPTLSNRPPDCVWERPSAEQNKNKDKQTNKKPLPFRHTWIRGRSGRPRRTLLPHTEDVSRQFPLVLYFWGLLEIMQFHLSVLTDSNVTAFCIPTFSLVTLLSSY